MKGGRRSFAEQTRARLLDLWSGEEAFGRPLGCVTTTFTFDAELFEEQCLARFLSIQSNPNETAKAYLVEREEKLSQCFACVLVDRAHVAPDRSLRWHLLPVTLPHGGVLHAKITLLVWEHCIRVLIGSANLTEPGYRRNQEVMAVLDFGPEDSPSPEILTECVTFLNRVRNLAPGSDRKESGPQAALAEFLRAVQQRVSALPPAVRADAACALVSLFPGDKSVVEQLGDLWRWPAPVNAWVLSPFYDKGKQASETAARFATLLTTKGGRSLVFTGPGRHLPDRIVEIDVPEVLKQSSHPSLEHRFSVIRERVEIEGKQEDRALHAKAVWLERDGHVIYMLGSSNFTAAGLGLHPGHNIELNIAYVIKDCTSQFGKLCVQSWPLQEELDNLDGVQFLADGLADSAENADVPLLPRAFGLALFCLDAQGGRLELEIEGKVVPVFEVRTKDGDVLIDSPGWLRGGGSGLVVIPWVAKRPPSSLEVRWRDAERGECAAHWIVNVADMSFLPAPEELGSLSLAELMEILTSARPMHEVVTRILDRRKKRPALGAPVEVEPHKKVDTSQFLLRRMRRVAQALEGMRERLQQPVGSAEALRWRLHGPIGPMALANRLSAEDPDGAAFMIAEVATTLRGVSWRPAGSLHRHAISVEVDKTVQALHELAIRAPAPANLALYVGAAFEELRP